jgi:NADPH:quinone reductase-like Zn-dependent oxidoreductase
MIDIVRAARASASSSLPLGRRGWQAAGVKAYVRERYCPPEGLELRELPVPEPPADGVLVHVRAVSLNRGDWYTARGRPLLIRLSSGLRRPKEQRVGWDFAGTVEAGGPGEPELRVGDEVYGVRTGAFAEYVSVTDGVTRKPAGLSFEEAAAIPTAGLTALQGLRDRARVREGQKVLVNGASGGVGTFAVQVAKALGAEVTAVCSTRNVEQARELGADRVIDYTREDFAQAGEQVDVLFDVAGSRPWRDCKRVLVPGGVLVQAGAPKENPVGHIVAIRLAAIGGGRRIANFVAAPSRDDLRALAELAVAGTLRPVVERRYAFGELREALAYVGEGHTRGKVVVAVS